MPTADFELDAATATTSRRPGELHRPGPAPRSAPPGPLETEFTVKYNGGWQNTGLIVWNGDNNFFRSSITHSLNGGNIYVEQSKDNPTSTEGARSQAGSNITLAAEQAAPVTIRMRYDARQRLQHGRARSTASWRRPSIAMADWVNFGGSPTFLDLNPTAARAVTRPARASASSPSRNFPGTTGTYAYAGTPGTVDVNYFRVTPDPITCETDAPTTTATLDPAAPATGDTYDRSVKVNLSATDAGTNAVGRREDRVPHHHQRRRRQLDAVEQHGRRRAVRERA